MTCVYDDLHGDKVKLLCKTFLIHCCKDQIICVVKPVLYSVRVVKESIAISGTTLLIVPKKGGARQER